MPTRHVLRQLSEKLKSRAPQRADTPSLNPPATPEQTDEQGTTRKSRWPTEHSRNPGTRRHPPANRQSDFASLVVDIPKDEAVNKVSSTTLVCMINIDGMIGALCTAALWTAISNLSLTFIPPHSVKQICTCEARQAAPFRALRSTLNIHVIPSVYVSDLWPIVVIHKIPVREAASRRSDEDVKFLVLWHWDRYNLVAAKYSNHLQTRWRYLIPKGSRLSRRSMSRFAFLSCMRVRRNGLSRRMPAFSVNTVESPLIGQGKDGVKNVKYLHILLSSDFKLLPPSLLLLQPKLYHTDDYTILDHLDIHP
ncbi:hypothetical protein CVT26_002239 [Gymnopilus dilepis]|uniref:Uncharacterized protein n=1 Tax=Gymnopilus dilepis TaxID=231916 RepID=A0A409YN64_9AGAR|nr:hypothetical protein CVT26_002239 [Gymnopilus dilepis]